MKMNNFCFTTFKELLSIDSFAKSRETIFPYQHEEFDDESVFLVCHGDAGFQDHFRLDIDLGWTGNDKQWIKQFQGLQIQKADDRIEGIIILGNLSVKGSVINEEGDYGAFLYVAGSISCQSFVAGGSVIYVQGDIITEDY